MASLSEVLTSDTVLGGIVLAVLGGTYAFCRTVVTKLQQNLDQTAANTSLLTTHTTMLESQNVEIAECKKELKVNSGSSLRDEVKRIGVVATTSVAQNDALIEDREMAAYRASPEGRCMYVSKRWCEMAGMSREEAMGYDGYGWNNSVRDDDRERVASKWKRALESGIPMDDKFHFRSGGWVTTHAEPFRDASGKVIVWIGTTEFVHMVEKIIDTSLKTTKPEGSTP